MRTHRLLDERSLALHRLVADKIRREPVLFDLVRSNLARLQAIVCASSQPHVQEWARLAGLGMDACLEVATEDSEAAAALRQSSPFAGILTNQERFSFLASWSARHGARGEVAAHET